MNREAEFDSKTKTKHTHSHLVLSLFLLQLPQRSEKNSGYSSCDIIGEKNLVSYVKSIKKIAHLCPQTTATYLEKPKRRFSSYSLDRPSFFAVALFFMFRNKISPRERENMWKKKKHFLTKRHSIHEILGRLNFSFGPNMEVINDLTPTQIKH